MSTWISENDEQMQPHSVWLLIGVGLLFACLMVVNVNSVVNRADIGRSHLERVAQQMSKGRQASQSIDNDWQLHLAGVLQGHIQGGYQAWALQLHQELNNSTRRSNEPNVDRDAQRVMVELDHLKQVDDLCHNWARQKVALEQKRSSAQKEAIHALDKLKEWIAGLERRLGNQMVRVVYRYRNASEPAIDRLVMELLGKFEQKNNLAIAKQVIAEMAKMFEGSSCVHQGNDSIKMDESKFKLSMVQLRLALGGSMDVDLKTKSHFLECATALFGEGFDLDSTHPTATKDRDGLFAFCNTLYRLMEERDHLLAKMENAFGQFEFERAKLWERTDVLDEVAMGKNEKAVSAAWTRIALISVGFFIAFLGFGANIARRTSRQIKANVAKSRELETQNQLIFLLQDVTMAANEAIDSKAAMQLSLERICFFCQCDVGFVWHADAPGVENFVVSECGYTSEPSRFSAFVAATRAAGTVQEHGGVAKVMESHQSVWLTDSPGRQHSARDSLGAKLGFVTEIAFPVMIDQEVVAVIEMYATTFKTPHTQTLAFFYQIGRQLGRVYERTRTNRTIEKINAQLVDASRQAGMAEVATGVLHNVGNILNSVNVSATIIQDRFEKSSLDSLQRITETLSAHEDDFADFVRENRRFQKLPTYLQQLAKAMSNERSQMDDEVSDLLGNVEHIKEIVSLQQSMASSSGLNQTLCPEEIIRNALTATKESLASHRVSVKTRVDPNVSELSSDKHRILQILINLVTNAKDALVEHEIPHPQLEIECDFRDNKYLFRVIDNGIGIADDQLVKIFGHGYTTKKHGHGFGLHGSANAATELGGDLVVQSEGIGKGATFELQLPLPEARRPEELDSTSNADALILQA